MTPRRYSQSPKFLGTISVVMTLALLFLASACHQGSQQDPTQSHPTAIDVSDPKSTSVSQSNAQDSDAEGSIEIAESTSGHPGNSASTVPAMSIVEQVKSAVVRINADTRSGSGVIVQTQDSTGYIVTNHHVINGASQVTVTVNDSEVFDGQVMGVDEVRDLAAITICCSNFQRVQFGDVSNLRPTAQVVIIGYPRSLPGEATFTQGIVSAVRFNSELQSEVFQTDAAINPGNSGGSMVSLGGQLLGIVTFKLTESDGVGFAVSADVVLQQLPTLWASALSPPPVPTPVPITHSGIDDSALEERIQDLLKELSPTVTIDTADEPQPTQRAPATQEFPTSTSLPPTPTPHPCSLAEIAPPGELELTYNRWLAASPDFQSVNKTFQGILEDQFTEVAAAYTIEFMAAPQRYASFRDYLGRVGLGADGDWMREALQAFLYQGLLPSLDESLYEYNQRRTADPCTLARSRVFADDEIMTLMAIGYSKSTSSPLAKAYAESAVIQAIYAFRDSDPITPLIFWIVERHNAFAD